MAEKKEKEVAVPSEAKLKFMHLMEVYKVQNPIKYELKKAELQKKLDAIV